MEITFGFMKIDWHASNKGITVRKLLKFSSFLLYKITQVYKIQKANIIIYYNKYIDISHMICF